MSKPRITIKASELTGMNIYHTKNQTIYYDFLSKSGYIITNDIVGKYTIFELDTPIALLIFCFVGIATGNYFFSAALGIVFFVIFELYFRLVFLKKLPIASNFIKTAKEPLATRFAKEMSFGRLILIAFLSLALVITLIANNLLMEYSTFYMILNYLLAVVAFGFFVLILIAIFRKKKN